MESIALIDLGILEKPMPINLLKAGFGVSGYNRTDSKTARENRTQAREAATGISVQQQRMYES